MAVSRDQEVIWRKTCCTCHKTQSGMMRLCGISLRLGLHADIDGFYWAKTTRGSQLGVKRKGASDIQFLGFREKVPSASSFPL